MVPKHRECRQMAKSEKKMYGDAANDRWEGAHHHKRYQNHMICLYVDGITCRSK